MDDVRGRELLDSGMRGRGEGRAFTVMGDALVLKVASPDIPHTIFEVTTRAPLGPPPRRQPWAESYLVLEGSLSVQLDDEWLTAGPGDVVYVPPNVTRWVQARDGKPCRYIVFASQSDLVVLFRALDQDPMESRRDIASTRDASRQFGVKRPRDES
jgi:mannose-6-phosphate isomerase-like protein (cupin superfamily)